MSSVPLALAQAVDLKWDGFGSVYNGDALTAKLLPDNFSSKDPDFTHFSLIGLNVNAKMSDQWSAAAQIIGRGSTTGSVGNSFNLAAAWAFIQYKVDDVSNVKAGRQRLPIFTASEYSFEHYLLPFRELPEIVYRLAPFASFDGLSASRGFDLGFAKLNFAIFGGTPLADVSQSALVSNGSNLLGARVNLEGDGWKLRLQGSRASEKISTSGGTTVTANQISFLSAGYRYDKYNIVSWGEYILVSSHDGYPLTYGPAVRTAGGGYVLLGYRIGDFMPRYTFAAVNSAYGFYPAGTVNNHTFGLNYTITPKLVAKAEYELDHISKPNVGAIGGFTQAAGSTTTTASALYAGLDFAF
jgi:hypothetical protein